MTRSFKQGLRINSIVMAAALVLSLSIGAYAGPRAASQDIVDTAVAAGSFRTLTAALQAAGLVDTCLLYTSPSPRD